MLLRKYRVHKKNYLKVGDVVVLRSPLDPDILITKRIMALQGEAVRTRSLHSQELTVIPPGHAWVEGDEKFHSRDSNFFGPVSLGLVQAKIVGILWPFTRAGPVSSLIQRDDRFLDRSSSTSWSNE